MARETSPRRLQTYVANRVGQILELLPSTAWRNIPTDSNPADCASRGILPNNYCNTNYGGTEWLLAEPSVWPIFPKIIKHQLDEPEVAVHFIAAKDLDLLDRYSDLTKLKRVLSWIFRFYNNCKKKTSRVLSHSLSVEEIKLTLNVLILISQSNYFFSEISDLRKGKDISPNSSLVSLRPFLDSEGVLRVGGRLHKSFLSYFQKHPVILHHKDPLSHLILKDLHTRLLHARPQQMISAAG